MNVLKIKKLKEKNPFISQVDIAYKIILKEIVSNNFADGEKINQESMACKLKMSRTPVREALNRLADEGYITRLGKSGYCICKVQLKDYVDFNEFRSRLECFGAYAATRNITNENLALLKENLELYIKACDEKDVETAIDLDNKFHKLIIMSSENEYLISAYKQIEVKQKIFLRYSIRGERLRYAREILLLHIPFQNHRRSI